MLQRILELAGDQVREVDKRSFATGIRENLDEAGGAVYPDSVPGLYFLGCIAASDHGRDAKFTGDDGRV